MKLLTNLTGETTEQNWNEPRGILQSVHDEPKPGLIRRMTLGAGGLMFNRGNIKVGIPMADLIALFEKAESGFTEIAPAPAAPDPEQQPSIPAS